MITVDMCLSGRELAEPRASPDGASVAFTVRWGSSSAVALVPITGGPERILTTAPQPSTGRGFGGGCLAWMPGGDGISPLEKVRAYNPDIPTVIFVTGFSDVSEEECLAKGAKSVLHKPFDRKQLMSLVMETLGINPDKKSA